MNRTLALWLGFLALWTATLLHFGAVRPWAVAATCAGTALLFGLSLVLIREPLRLARAGVGLLAAFAGLFVLQLLPLPWLFPYTARLREAHGMGQAWPGTADAHEAMMFLGQFAAAVMAGLLVLRLRQAGLRTTHVLQGVVAVLALEAAFGVVRAFAGWPNPPFHEGPSSGAGSAAGTLVKTPLFQEVLPSKIFESLAMERPILLGVGGEARRLVEEAGAGEYVPPEDSAALAEAIRRWAARPDLREMGRRGRELVLRSFDRRALAARHLEILDKIVRG